MRRSLASPTRPDDPRHDPAYQGESAYYLSINRNKRSLRLDLRTPAGAGVLRRLLERSDVLIENQRVGGLARLGFPDEELDRLNPRLVHLAISGYGVDGPLADRPGYDFVIQAASGLMSITGQAGRRRRPGDQGRGRHQRPDHRHARRRGRAGRAARAWSGRR